MPDTTKSKTITITGLWERTTARGDSMLSGTVDGEWAERLKELGPGTFTVFVNTFAVEGDGKPTHNLVWFAADAKGSKGKADHATGSAPESAPF